MTINPGAQIANLVNINVRDILRVVAADTRIQAHGSIDRFAKALSNDRSSVSRGMKELHRHVSSQARQSIIRAYQEAPIGSKESYRDRAPGKLKRYSRGAMERALKNPNIISYNHKEISFVNKKTLDRTAKQWYRLNFGAGPKGRGGTKPKVKGWNMGGRRLGFTLSLAGYPKSPNFKVPHSLRYSGVWSNKFSPTNLSLSEARRRPASGRSGALYLVPMQRVSGRQYWERKERTGKGPRDWRWKREKMRPAEGTNRGTWSSGIKGHHFLEQGLDTINREYPRQLNSLINTWVNAARDSIGRRRPFVWQPI